MKGTREGGVKTVPGTQGIAGKRKRGRPRKEGRTPAIVPAGIGTEELGAVPEMIRGTSVYGSGAYESRAIDDLLESLKEAGVRYQDALDGDLLVKVSDVCPEAFMIHGMEEEDVFMISLLGKEDSFDDIPVFLSVTMCLEGSKKPGKLPLLKLNEVNASDILCGKVFLNSLGNTVYALNLPLRNPGRVSLLEVKLILDIFRKEMDDLLGVTR